MPSKVRILDPPRSTNDPWPARRGSWADLRCVRCCPAVSGCSQLFAPYVRPSARPMWWHGQARWRDADHLIDLARGPAPAQEWEQRGPLMVPLIDGKLDAMVRWQAASPVPP